MCGIAGIINSHGITDTDKILLCTMSERIKHRGPDGDGVFYDNKIGLAHRRLSIIDVTKKGCQPMSYIGRYTITFNGEIYNYIELRNELNSKGYTFESNSDTEVILACYDCYGAECVKLFNGMWAFAIYDKYENTVFISRDRYGVKPIHYYIGDEYLIFASEIKALLCDKRIKRVANDELIYDFLVDSLLDHTNQTCFKNIYKVPPASYVIIRIDEPIGSINFIKYYDVNFSKKDESMHIDDAKIEFRNIFEDSIKKRLRSDVPVGTCLSGGIDSSSIVMAVNKTFGAQEIEQHTFSFTPSDKNLNEREYIEDVLYGRKIIPHYITDDSFEIEKDFCKLVESQEEPFRTMSMFAGYLVYKEARKNGIVVLLDGQGADEILCGYRKSRIYYIKQLLKKHKYLTASKELVSSVSQFETTSSFKADFEKIRKIINRRKEYKSKYLKDDFLNQHNSKNIYGTGDFQNSDVKLISLPILLRYVDRNSMAVSVESRLPFLDYRLVDLCAKFPLSFNIRNGYSKYIMRQSLDLPDSIKNRKSKFGFVVPETMWIKKYKQFFIGFFDMERFRAGKYIDREAVVENWDKLVDGIDKNLLFRMISVAAWMEIYKVQN